jgi:hypothetical protein
LGSEQMSEEKVKIFSKNRHHFSAVLSTTHVNHKFFQIMSLTVTVNFVSFLMS